ncbi:beta-ketoacyl synthase N-terminal-like domain-containing protein [Reichenbachiella ulvae]|uniref:Beta-ketoacyl synthase n=1 Tax=Reichenbachiella ulvae TaxID=2980104 RepID=A0ABT3CU11_9BACT|nr:beta-ketoacyl synthase N-terminal-like domain-containing protein [Reichenbachiella ulvae]MCV9387186.1 beta-ketoacyl synthase [Reichenbachiella ulvae]
MSYIGAEHIISPLGVGAHVNFAKAQQGISGLKKHEHYDHAPSNIPFGIIEDYNLEKGLTKLESLVLQSCQYSLSRMNDLEGKWLMIFCTTKGDVDRLAAGLSKEVRPQFVAEVVASKLDIQMDIEVVSNACISGLLGVVMAHDYIATNNYDKVMVIGADVFSEFTCRGFESFMALSDRECKPFDANRNGLSLGEAIATAVVTGDKKDFMACPKEVLGGASANDANHISGPSRTGEGLYRSITKALKQSALQVGQIDAISAHGTATRYNDDMESIAFHRMGLTKQPVNSMKGYFGHTLGAAGLLELVMCMQSMDNNEMLATKGCESPGTTEKINVLTENKAMQLNTILKTTSGFGGCNAAAVIRKVEC